jgi:hypothetical protein
MTLGWPSAPATVAPHRRQDREMSVGARTIVELNIQHYRNLLKTETDATRRQTISRLLGEQEAALAKLLAEERGDRTGENG